MNELEKRLEAIANRRNFQEARVVWPYPTEWDVVQSAYLANFNYEGSPNQHIYYFKS